MTKRFRVTVNPDGTVTAAAEGQPGPKCLDELATLTALVPYTTIADSRLTDEYYRPQSVYLQQTDNSRTQLEDRQ